MRYIAVFCGSSIGNQLEYMEAAEKLGREIVKAGYGLIYGASNAGLMGIVAKKVLEEGGEVIGLATPEVKAVVQPKVKVIQASSYAQRKQKMFELADGFIALPGGLGTMDEAFEIMVGNQLRNHENSPSKPKPFCLLNVCQFFDPTLKQLDLAVTEGFLKQAHRDMILSFVGPSAAVQYIQSKDPQADQDSWKKSKQIEFLVPAFNIATTQTEKRPTAAGEAIPPVDTQSAAQPVVEQPQFNCLGISGKRWR